MIESLGWIRWISILTGVGFLAYAKGRGPRIRSLHFLTGLYCLWAAIFLSLDRVAFEGWKLGIGVGLVVLSSVFLGTEILIDGSRLFLKKLKLKSTKNPRLAPYLLEISRGLTHLSQRKVGALIVIEKDQPLSLYMTKGLSFDAEVKAEILISLFTPASPVHDGAIIVRNGRIRAVKVVLPLATRKAVPLGVGVRHRAAMAITESTDAVALVASEERGEMSVASKGELTKATSAEELHRLILAALRNRKP